MSLLMLRMSSAVAVQNTGLMMQWWPFNCRPDSGCHQAATGLLIPGTQAIVLADATRFAGLRKLRNSSPPLFPKPVTTLASWLCTLAASYTCRRCSASRPRCGCSRLFQGLYAHLIILQAAFPPGLAYAFLGLPGLLALLRVLLLTAYKVMPAAVR